MFTSEAASFEASFDSFDRHREDAELCDDWRCPLGWSPPSGGCWTQTPWRESSWWRALGPSPVSPSPSHWPEFRCFQHFELRLGDSWTISDLWYDLMVSGVWHFKGTVCTVILRCCKPKSDQKCRSYVTLKHQWILNLQFDHFFRGLKRGVFDKIRCSQWLQGMVLDGLEWFKAKNRKSMTFNYKSAGRYLVLALLKGFWSLSCENC